MVGVISSATLPPPLSSPSRIVSCFFASISVEDRPLRPLGMGVEEEEEEEEEEEGKGVTIAGEGAGVGEGEERSD